MGFAWWVGVGTFALTVMCPNAFEILGVGAPETLMVSLCILLAAETAIALNRGGLPRFVAVGAIAGYMVIARPELILVLVPLGCAIAIWAIAKAIARKNWRRWSAGPAALAGMILVIVVTVAVLNGAVFGRFRRAMI